VIICNEQKENFRPKNRFQTVLCFDYSQIIASGDHATVEQRSRYRPGEERPAVGGGGEGEQASKVRSETILVSKPEF